MSDKEKRALWRKLAQNQDDPDIARQYANLLERGPESKRWVSAGLICVDGGRVVIGDVGHARAQLEQLRNHGDYAGEPNGVRQLGLGIGGSLALIVDSGFGDGGYEVLVRYTERTNVPAEIRVIFVPDGQDRCAAEACEFGYVNRRAANGFLLSTNECPSCNGSGLSEARP